MFKNLNQALKNMTKEEAEYVFCVFFLICIISIVAIGFLIGPAIIAFVIILFLLIGISYLLIHFFKTFKRNWPK